MEEIEGVKWIEEKLTNLKTIMLCYKFEVIFSLCPTTNQTIPG